MPSKPRTEIKIIESLERLNNSQWGNPRYKVYFTDGTSAISHSDASVNYTLPNLLSRENRSRPAVFTFTRAGRITHATMTEER